MLTVKLENNGRFKLVFEDSNQKLARFLAISSVNIWYFQVALKKLRIAEKKNSPFE